MVADEVGCCGVEGPGGIDIGNGPNMLLSDLTSDQFFAARNSSGTIAASVRYILYQFQVVNVEETDLTLHQF